MNLNLLYTIILFMQNSIIQLVFISAWCWSNFAWQRWQFKILWMSKKQWPKKMKEWKKPCTFVTFSSAFFKWNQETLVVRISTTQLPIQSEVNSKRNDCTQKWTDFAVATHCLFLLSSLNKIVYCINISIYVCGLLKKGITTTKFCNEIYFALVFDIVFVLNCFLSIWCKTEKDPLAGYFGFRTGISSLFDFCKYSIQWIHNSTISSINIVAIWMKRVGTNKRRLLRKLFSFILQNKAWKYHSQ